MVIKTNIAVFGSGCFWCTEAVFSQLKGVVSVTPGYAGGHKERPTYEEVCSGVTGHAEVVKVAYDPAIISYRDLLTVFFAIHDPTTSNRQGSDVGEQYRSLILYIKEAQKREAEDFIAQLGRQGTFSKPIVTQVKPLTNFYEAEEYHRKYYEKNPEKAYCQVVIAPKIAHLQEKFIDLLNSRK